MGRERRERLERLRLYGMKCDENVEYGGTDIDLRSHRILNSTSNKI